MSGGVDSAVAAARAVDAGHEVVGVHLALSRMPGTLRTGSRGCCTIEDSMDAQRAATALGIPFYVWDFSDRFKEEVVDDFIAEYSAGRTPNPCLRCNERIKFAALLDKAIALGFDAVATGHYATLVEDAVTGRATLHRASDRLKDQSYVLGVLTQQQLQHCMFPLGDAPSKAEVRAEAAARGLTVAQKPDSHDICFIPDGDTRGWLAEKLGTSVGPIVERDGTVVGSHGGAHGYTVGQRRGLAIGRPAPDGQPRFVLEIRPKDNTVVVGPKQALAVGELAGTRMSWAGPTPDELGLDARGCRVEVQIRAHADPVPATMRLAATGTLGDAASHPAIMDPELVIEPDEPLVGVALGQSAVIYLPSSDGPDRVLGQVKIDRTVAADTVAAHATATPA